MVHVLAATSMRALMPGKAMSRLAARVARPSQHRRAVEVLRVLYLA